MWLQQVVKLLAAVFMNRIQENVFDRERVAVLPIQLFASFGLPHINPIGGTITVATKAALFDKGLQNHGLLTAALSAIMWQLLGDTGQDSRCEVV